MLTPQILTPQIIKPQMLSTTDILTTDAQHHRYSHNRYSHHRYSHHRSSHYRCSHHRHSHHKYSHHRYSHPCHTICHPGGHGKEGPTDHPGGRIRFRIVGTPHIAESILPSKISSDVGFTTPATQYATQGGTARRVPRIILGAGFD